MNRAGLAILGGFLAADTAVAREIGSQWNGEAELGIVSTEGNTETQTISAKGKVVNERAKWKHQAGLEALNTEDNNTTTAERYTLSGKTGYKFTAGSYLFGIATLRTTASVAMIGVPARRWVMAAA